MYMVPYHLYTSLTLTGFAKSSKFTALNTPVVLAPLRPPPGSWALPLLLVPPEESVDILYRQNVVVSKGSLTEKTTLDAK